VQSAPKLFATSGSTSNVGQILKHKRCSRTNRIYEPTGQNMVAIAPKPILSARHPFKMPFGRFCAFALKSATMLEGLLLNRLPSWFSIKVASTVCGWIDNAKVNPNPLLRGCKLRCFRLHNNMQPPTLFLVPTQICAARFPSLLNVFLVIFRAISSVHQAWQ